MKKFFTLLTSAVAITMVGCKSQEQTVNIPCEKYTLPNGLQVVMQQDHSDPVVAVVIQYHVGSAREKTGRTGFAHFFEHMLFQRSENLPRNAFFQKISALGGDFNGSTDCDGTRYHEIVPRDALEKVLWMESDRMGYFINTVTQGGLEREIDVVSNEKRQSYDTRPYGQLIPIMSRYAFPEGHPYNWTTIGDLDDLRGATVDEVKEFYKTFYKPSNATIVISGDFDIEKAKELVEKYFAEIPAGDKVEPIKPQPAPMAQTVKVVHQDAYASMPMLAVVYPTVPKYDPDSYAVSMLSQALSEGKNSPLYKVIVDEKKLAPEIEMWYWDRELAGTLMLIVPAFDGVNTNDIYAAVQEAYARFEKDGVSDQALEGYKAVTEVGYYNRMSGIMNRALDIADENTYGGDPLRGFKELSLYKNVTKEQVMAAYNKYIKGRTDLQICIVPKGAENLALTGAIPAVVKEEKVSDQQMKSSAGAVAGDDNNYVRTVSKFDRSQEPDLLPNTPVLNPPAVWSEKLADGLTVWGATNDEMPIVRFSMRLTGGMLYDPTAKSGVANLYAQTLLAGTADKTPEQLEDAFKRLGADVNCNAGVEGVTVSGTCLARNLHQAMDLLSEVLTKPRFDTNEFSKAKQSALATIAQQSDDIGSIAMTAMRKVLYAKGSPLANQVTGTAASVAAITADDIKKYHADFISPTVANMHFAGNVTLDAARNAMGAIDKEWKGSSVPAPAPVALRDSVMGKIFFIDQPGSQQSCIFVLAPAMPLASPDYYPAYIANYHLGDGSQGLLFDELRLKHGYTYGAYSSFMAANYNNLFLLSTQVIGIKTRESLALIKQILDGYAAGYTDSDMQLTRESILKSNYGAYETLGSLVGMLTDISSFGLPQDYVKQRDSVLKNMTTAQVQQIAHKWIDPAKMSYIVVGDAATQLAGLKTLGMGDPILLDKQGNPTVATAKK